ncbi:MAG TPA: Rcas_1661 family thioredoxin-like (seleno)lipoprotein [Roseiflexaceae bacterium]|nr:Rcas_1661 family thioredoxin-like (seleno)lipoprotein [Roseiflexaceae bacterium]
MRNGIKWDRSWRSPGRTGSIFLLSIVLAACGSVSPSTMETAPTAAPAAIAAVHPTGAAPTSAGAAAEQGVTAEGYHFRGRADAPVTMQDFSDFLCTECHAFATQTEPKIAEAYIATGKVRFVFRHLLQLGPGSVRTAEASECAGDQGQFWPMHDMLYARQQDVFATNDLDALLITFAKDLGLDSALFSTCLQSHKHLTTVQNDYSAAQQVGIRGRPSFDINGTRVIGAQPFSVFQQTIDTALAK